MIKLFKKKDKSKKTVKQENVSKIEGGLKDENGSKIENSKIQKLKKQQKAKNNKLDKLERKQKPKKRKLTRLERKQIKAARRARAKARSSTKLGVRIVGLILAIVLTAGFVIPGAVMIYKTFFGANSSSNGNFDMAGLQKLIEELMNAQKKSVPSDKNSNSVVNDANEQGESDQEEADEDDELEAEPEEEDEVFEE